MFETLRRLWRHRWLDERDTRRAIDPELVQRLTRRVRASEQRHTGEIRLCIEASLPNSYLLRSGTLSQITRQRALTMFGKLRVWDTEHNNGVLIYLLMPEHAFEIVADRGLARQVPPEVWQEMAAQMSAQFRQGHYEEGLSQAVSAVGALLIQHFPRAADSPSPNELPDAPIVR